MKFGARIECGSEKIRKEFIDSKLGRCSCCSPVISWRGGRLRSSECSLQFVTSTLRQNRIIYSACEVVNSFVVNAVLFYDATEAALQPTALRNL